MKLLKEGDRRVTRRERPVLSDCDRSAFWEERFREFNKKYFEGRLPQYKVYLCNECLKVGQCFREKKRIRMKRYLSFAQKLAVLLHEMIHIKVLAHGKRYVEEWERICKLGAPVGKWKGVQSDTIPARRLKLNEKNVRDVILDVSREVDPSLGWWLPRSPRRELMHDLMPHLETEFSMPQAKIRKKINMTKILDETMRELEEEIERARARYGEF
jgi:hypothetical protein